MKKLFISFSLMLIVTASFAQSVTGDWYGLLKAGGANLHVVIHLAKTDTGYTATMDSPDQKAMGIPMDKVSYSDHKLVLGFTAGGMTYNGNFLPDSNKINGLFQQGGGSFPLNLSREKGDEKPAVTRRPQDPKDYPYKQEEVTFTNVKSGNQLAGTLTLPAGGKATKIAIFITGSGPQNRDEEFQQFNHRPFLVLSDWLTRNGIAVLRYDDRGVGKSTGDFKTATTADFADDTEAAVSYIKSRPDLKSLSIGLLGHSEGGMIAPMVASRNKDVKFMVLLAGPGIPIAKLMVKQTEDQLRVSGAADSLVKQSAATSEQTYAFVNANKTLPAAVLKSKLDSFLIKEYSAYPKGTLGNGPIDQLAGKTSERITSPWFRYFLGFNPAEYLVKVKCPTLALNGTTDKQVDAGANLAAIKAGLTAAGNKHFEIVPMPSLNHMFQKAVTGSVPEYGELTETINPAALTKIAGWINQL